MKISSYSFFSFKRFSFFSPFGFASFLNRVYEVAYHYKYKKDFPLFSLSSVGGGELSSFFEESKDSFDFFDIVNTAKFVKKAKVVEKNQAMLKASFKKNRKSLTLFKLRSSFSRFFLRSLFYFRKKFFFSFFNRFRYKISKFFRFFFFKLDKAIFFFKKSIFVKFYFFFFNLKRVPSFKFFFTKRFSSSYYNHFFRFFVFSKVFFFKKEIGLLRKLVSFRNKFKKFFFFVNKERFFRFFFFWKKFFFLGSFFFFNLNPLKKNVYYLYKIVIFRVLIKLLKN